ncbi:hypothetical protein IT084_04310 [Desulfallas sp. Bu1-1]|jgi:serine phosphatase RsbU (regulator of sigma subunit)|uniref:hypothetical protein n=1 Tax=Desulfallas sp. Bu1-1 TaxID=2787620 RepID=UPI00189F9E01|nr:hypothetical protein [Desulfallas sp. Bu1-1]MBF7082198.1 hypothetical protein [Desulfallas sp. Bu1-1]
MENARALDDRLRKIIREVSDSTGQEIKRDLVQELARLVNENHTREIYDLLNSLNRALKKI